MKRRRLEQFLQAADHTKLEGISKFVSSSPLQITKGMMLTSSASNSSALENSTCSAAETPQMMLRIERYKSLVPEQRMKDCFFDSPVSMIEADESKWSMRPTGIAALDSMLSYGKIMRGVGHSSLQQVGPESKKGGSQIGIPPGVIVELFDYTQNGAQYISTSMAVACATEDMKTLFIGPTNSVTQQAVEDYTRVVAKDNVYKMKCRAKANTNIYRAYSSSMWDLVHQVEKATKDGTFHTVVLVGLPLLLAELDPHLLYQTLSDRGKQSHAVLFSHRPVAVNAGDYALTSLLRRLGISLRGLAATGTSVLVCSTPVDAEFRGSKRKRDKPFVFSYSGSKITPQAEEFLCSHVMDPAATCTSCSCSIVRAAFLVLFKDVFDISLDLTGHHPKETPSVEATSAEGVYVCSLRCESNIIAAGASQLKPASCTFPALGSV